MNTLQLNLSYWHRALPGSIPGNHGFPSTDLQQYLVSGSRILDIGCGDGNIARSLAMNDFIVEGVDINETLIRTNSKDTSLHYSVGNVLDGLPFPDGYFDGIVLAFVLASMTSDTMRVRTMMEVNRLVRKGGIVWIHDGLVSPDYTKRYELSSPFVNDPHSFFVFSPDVIISNIQTVEQLKEMIKLKKVERVAHHYEEKELYELCRKFSVLKEERIDFVSTNKTHTIQSMILVVQKA